MIIRNVFKVVIFLAAAAGYIYGGAEITSFNAKSENGNVVLTWHASSETNLKYYVVERSTVKGNYIEIATVYPNANKSYEYIDESAYKDADAVYIYRIKIVDNNGEFSYTQPISVTHSGLSDVRRTWGSIKALFK